MKTAANDNSSGELEIVRPGSAAPADAVGEGRGVVVVLDGDRLAEALKRPENASALARILLRALRPTLTSTPAAVPATGGGKR